MAITPLGSRVLLTEDKQSRTTSSGIIVEGGNDDTKVYTVVDVGQYVSNLTNGDKVYIDREHVKIILSEGKYFAIIDEDYILGVVR